MSEFIDNSKYRRDELKKLIKRLHDGASVDDVKDEFQKNFGEISTTEISQIEQELVKEGLPIEEVQRLCDVHASVFDGSIEDIHHTKDQTSVKGHPAYIFKKENDALEKVITEEIHPYAQTLNEGMNQTAVLMLRIGLERLSEVNIHFARKENVFFPLLEKYGITAPPKVMWGIDDEIRKELKEVLRILSQDEFDLEEMLNKAKAVVQKTKDMIFKENNILLPLMNDTFTIVEWFQIDKAQRENGLCLIEDVTWDKNDDDFEEEEKIEESINGEINFDAGTLTNEEVNAILNTVPLDMTFVDKNDKVKYFTQGKERIFDRPHTILGRDVNMCHPPSSVHIVEKIVSDLRSGKKDNEDFWIRMGNMFVYIRYFAVRNNSGEFLGTLEVTQNIKPITELEGEKRLLED
ncbi:MAG: DUF438 domain-containing protein [Candidatus Izemoplasmataceae bacterium]